MTEAISVVRRPEERERKIVGERENSSRWKNFRHERGKEREERNLQWNSRRERERECGREIRRKEERSR